MLTMYDDDENVLAALRAGAFGYMLKGAGPDELVAAVRAVARGEALFGAGIAARMLDVFGRSAATAPFPQATEREAEVRGLLAAGLDNAVVARRVGVSAKTVRNHSSNIIKLTSRTDRRRSFEPGTPAWSAPAEGDGPRWRLGWNLFP